jgi:hypothetical protein
MKPIRNKFPKGWNEKKVRGLIKHYETQTEAEAVAEDEAAYHSARITMMAVPTKLVPQVQRLITKAAG